MRQVTLAFCVFWITCSTVSAVERRTPLHPPVPLLDANGKKVVASGQPVSTMVTCAACHDTKFITTHSYHAWVGRRDRFDIGSSKQQRRWDYSPSLFGKWDPIFYRYLTYPGDAKLDLGTAEWIQYMGWRHVGGGPAEIGHGDSPLDQRARKAKGSGIDPDLQVLDPATGKPKAWDWKASGTVETNCFLCHIHEPDNAARVKELSAGHFKWASTATLAKTGLVEATKDGWKYKTDVFSAAGEASAKTLGLWEPNPQRCGQCHGKVHFGDQPLMLKLDPKQWATATKGEVFSPQRISMAGANIKDKQHLARPWDVHAASMLECRNCHFSLNAPAEFQPPADQQPRHLRFEPRRLDMAEFIVQPSHQFAKGHSCQGLIAPQLDNTMRNCEDCHNADAVHDWLPYRDYHFSRLTCEACHIPKAYAPALQQVDWTVLSPAGEPNREWRGIEGNTADPDALVTGFEPVLLAEKQQDQKVRLEPLNLIGAWYWVEGNETDPRPVRLADLKKALLDGDHYQPEILAALDTNKNGTVELAERRLDNPDKVKAVHDRLVAVGVDNPRISAELDPHGLHHDVGPATWASKKCSNCHTKNSRLARSFEIASYVPGGVMPEIGPAKDFALDGVLTVNDEGRLVITPSMKRADVYVLGHNHWAWVDNLGFLILILTLLGVCGHGALRILAASRQTKAS